MKRRLSRLFCTLGIAALALPAVAEAPPRRETGGSDARRPAPRGYANPSAVIAAELALARDVAARGQWTALAAAAAPEAVVFTPRLAWAHGWLKSRANPPAAPRWQPRAVWSSCDGALVVSRGEWQDSAGKAGWFTRVWQRQEGGDYKWLVTSTGPLMRADAEPDMISAEVADCPARVPRGDGGEGHGRGKPPKPPKPVKVKNLPPLDPARHGGAAPDGTLRWEASVAPDGAERLTVTWRKNGADGAIAP